MAESCGDGPKLGRKEGRKEGARGGREGERGKGEGERGEREGEGRGEGVKRWKMAGNLKLVPKIVWSVGAARSLQLL